MAKIIFQAKKALGINARFRFYRYQAGDYFKPHTDGAWPGSRAWKQFIRMGDVLTIQ